MDSDTMACPAEAYVGRRSEIAKFIQEPLCLFAGDTQARNYDANYFPFRAGSTYRYFGGPPLAGAAILIEPGSDGWAGTWHFRPTWGVENAVWVGECVSDDAIASAGGFERGSVVSIEKLADRIGGREGTAIHPPNVATLDFVRNLGLSRPTPEILSAIVNMRLIKDEHELVAIRRAVDIGVEMHLAAGKACRAGASESNVAGAIHGAMISRGGRPAFSPIASVRGEILHSEGYPGRLADGQLLLVDAGAEERCGYASDMTRVFPVSGKFEKLQRDLYETVLRSQERAIDACVVGARFRDIHDLAATVLCEGLVDLGFLSGNVTDLVERRAHTLFFPHGLGHLIGLDVHDMEDFGDLAGYGDGRVRRKAFGDKYLRLDRDLRAGMTVTIEPGLYFIPPLWENDALVGPFRDCVNRTKVDALLEAGFGGIRIEDIVRVCEAGPEVLSAGLPKSVADVEAIVGGSWSGVPNGPGCN